MAAMIGISAICFLGSFALAGLLVLPFAGFSWVSTAVKIGSEIRCA